MRKPEDVSQEAWDAAVAALHLGGEPYVDAKAAAVARAIMAAKAEEREACAKVAEGEDYHTRYRTWPWWKMADGCGNRGNDSELVRHADDIAAAIRSRKEVSP